MLSGTLEIALHLGRLARTAGHSNWLGPQLLPLLWCLSSGIVLQETVMILPLEIENVPDIHILGAIYLREMRPAPSTIAPV